MRAHLATLHTLISTLPFETKSLPLWDPARIIANMAANRSINRPQIGTRQGMVGARLLVRGVPRRLLFVTWFMSQLPSLSSVPRRPSSRRSTSDDGEVDLSNIVRSVHGQPQPQPPHGNTSSTDDSLSDVLMPARAPQPGGLNNLIRTVRHVATPSPSSSNLSALPQHMLAAAGPSSPASSILLDI